jgi:hypothetical protein
VRYVDIGVHLASEGGGAAGAVAGVEPWAYLEDMLMQPAQLRAILLRAWILPMDGVPQGGNLVGQIRAAGRPSEAKGRVCGGAAYFFLLPLPGPSPLSLTITHLPFAL